MLLALLVAAAAAPQVPIFSDPGLAEALGRFDPHPGAWADYAVLPRNGPQTKLRVSVLSPALPEGRYWLEAVTQRQDGPAVAVRMLLHGEPGRLENLERMYVYVLGLAPMEFPIEEVREGAKQPATPLPVVKHKGRRELKLAAGAFRCEVLQVRHTRIFRSGEVPLWGLVRADDPDQRIELLGYAKEGARTVFPPEFLQGNGSESVK